MNGDGRDFQAEATRRLAAILSRHGISPTFVVNDTYAPYVAADFVHANNRFRLEIYQGEIGLEINEGRVDSEIYASSTDESKMADFERRFERVLNGGTWFGSEDPSLPEATQQSLRGCLRWFWRH